MASDLLEKLIADRAINTKNINTISYIQREITAQWPFKTWLQERIKYVKMVEFRERFIFDPEPVTEGDIWQKKQKK